MAENTKIQWCDHTFNPWRGCTKVSPGCANCYAETQSKRNPGTLGTWGPEGTRVVASEKMWAEPLKWNRQTAERFANWQRAAMMNRSEYDCHDPWERPRVFCASMADVFEDWPGQMHASNGNPLWWCGGSLSNSPVPSTGIPDGSRWATMNDIRERLFQLIDDTPQLDWLLLTKRPERMARWIAGAAKRGYWPKPNVWLGVSVEDQQRADERIPVLLSIPAKVRFLSVEPLLGPVDLERYLWGTAADTAGRFVDGKYRSGGPGGQMIVARPLNALHWVIIGGESGHNARACRVEWVQSLVHQCQHAGVACFVKQLGSDVEVNTATLGPFHLVDTKGGDPNEWPTDLRVREFPEVEQS